MTVGSVAEQAGPDKNLPQHPNDEARVPVHPYDPVDPERRADGAATAGHRAFRLSSVHLQIVSREDIHQGDAAHWKKSFNVALISNACHVKLHVVQPT